MSDTIQRLLRLVHATTPRLCTTTTLSALGTAYLLYKWGASKSRETARCSFDTLPLDVLLEIFTYLDCVEVVRVRRVCQSLCNATKARPVWLRLFHLDALDSGHRRIYLDRTLESHSAAELEAAVLKPHKGDFWWTNCDPYIRKTRINNGHEILRLLPGGRWCLARSESTSTVVCYDFSDTGRDEAPCFPLASTPLHLLPGTRYRSGPVIDVDIDTTTPYLTFHLAVYFTRSDLDVPDDGTCNDHPILQIWKVTPCFDASGRIHCLAAQHLRTFHRAIHGGLGFLQIRGQCIAIREGTYYRVFDWVNTPPDIDASLPLIWSDDINFQYKLPAGGVHTLLPGRRVLLDDYNKVSIGYIPSTQPFSCRTQMPSLPVIWTGKIPPFLSIYGPFFSPNADVFALISRDNDPSFLLTIPKDFTSPDDPHKPRIEPVVFPAKPFLTNVPCSWSPGRFAYLCWKDTNTNCLLLRRGRVPYPASTPVMDFVYDDFHTPPDCLEEGEYTHLGGITFDECSSSMGVQVDISTRASVLLFEPSVFSR